MKTPTVRTRKGRTLAMLACAVLPVAGVGALSVTIPQPVVLWNGTPSEPVGLYLRSAAKPSLGTIIAFRAPAEAFPYADARMSYLHHILILKAVAARQGDRVCTAAHVLTINGRWRAPVLNNDSRGVKLPAWQGCRTLAEGEFFVFSDAVPNSFDSRYYGPVGQGAIVGVYRPVMVVSGAARAA